MNILELNLMYVYKNKSTTTTRDLMFVSVSQAAKKLDILPIYN